VKDEKKGRNAQQQGEIFHTFEEDDGLATTKKLGAEKPGLSKREISVWQEIRLQGGGTTIRDDTTTPGVSQVYPMRKERDKQHGGRRKPRYFVNQIVKATIGRPVLGKVDFPAQSY